MEHEATRLTLRGTTSTPAIDNLRFIKHPVVVFSGKGGVGKTTVAVNVAFALAKRGLRVGLLDADVTGPDVPKMTGLRDKPTVEEGNRMTPPQVHGVKVMSIASIIAPETPIIWRGPLRSKALSQFLEDVSWGELDFLIADLPPGTGDEVLTMAQSMKPEAAIVVTTPQEMSLIDSRRAINMAKKMGIGRIGVVENMSELGCPRCGFAIEVFGSGGGRRVAEELGVELLGTVPIDLRARAGADHGRPIVLEDEASDMSRALGEIADEVSQLASAHTRSPGSAQREEEVGP